MNSNDRNNVALFKRFRRRKPRKHSVLMYWLCTERPLADKVCDCPLTGNQGNQGRKGMALHVTSCPCRCLGSDDEAFRPPRLRCNLRQHHHVALQSPSISEANLQLSWIGCTHLLSNSRCLFCFPPDALCKLATQFNHKDLGIISSVLRSCTSP